MGEIVVARIKKEDIPRVWRLARPFVKRALRYADGQMAPDHVLAELLADRAQLWFVWDRKERKLLGVATTQVVKFPLKQILRVITVAGTDGRRWGRKLDEALTAYARGLGIRKLDAIGRRGLERRLEPLGWKAEAIIVGKEI